MIIEVDGGERLALDHDGYYWFLHDLWVELFERTGQYVDLYGDAVFGSAEIRQLAATLSEARRLVDAQADAWDVRIGREGPRPVTDRVEKDAFLSLLDRFDALVHHAIESELEVNCIGD